MKIPKIVSAMGHLDDELIASGAEEKREEKRRRPLLKWGGVAACFVLAAAVLLILSPRRATGGESDETGSEGGVSVPSYIFPGEEMAMEWPWEYKLLWEKYYSADYGSAEYTSCGAPLGEDLLGQALGSCVARGEDVYTGQIHTEELEAFEIRGISPKRMIALGKDGVYGVYTNASDPFPATLGEAAEAFGLEMHLTLSRFAEHEGYTEKGYRRIMEDDPILEVLARCGEVKRVKDLSPSWLSERRYLTFTVTSEALGVYKRVLYVTEDGYLATNIFNVEAAYFIGEEAAMEIIRFARENSVEADFEPYEQRVAGTVTEIGEDYLLVDSSVLCGDPEKGQVYRVPLTDLRIRRSLEFGGIRVGDVVSVAFRGELTEENLVLGAVSVARGKLVEGDVAIPE